MERRGEDFNRAVFEAHDYRPAMRRFREASRANPDLLIDVDLRPGAVVLDVGAYEGSWSSRVLQRADAGGSGLPLQVHAFEPEPNALALLRSSRDLDERVRVHPFGLAGADRVETMTLAGPGSSVFGKADGAVGLGTIDIPLRDVSVVLEELAVDRIDFVKINIEGGEYELIDRLHDTGWLARTGPLIVQFHEFTPNAYGDRRRSRRHLAHTHRCTWSYPWVFERWDPR